MSIGAFIKQLRQAHHVGQRQLARLISDNGRDDASYLSKIESGKRLPSRDILEKIAAALQLSDEDRDTLFFLGGKIPPSMQGLSVERFQFLRRGLQ